MAIPETKPDNRPGALRVLRGMPARDVHEDGDFTTATADRDGSPPAERLAYSVAEAAMLTGLSCDLLYDQMRTGRLAFVKVGRRRIITRQNLDDFLARSAS
jgi:excisionase family DNA binding protein